VFGTETLCRGCSLGTCKAEFLRQNFSLGGILGGDINTGPSGEQQESGNLKNLPILGGGNAGTNEDEKLFHVWEGLAINLYIFWMSITLH
jgi:hypothetical protein